MRSTYANRKGHIEQTGTAPDPLLSQTARGMCVYANHPATSRPLYIIYRENTVLGPPVCIEHLGKALMAHEDFTEVKLAGLT